MAKESLHFRLHPDIANAARARAATEHRTLTDVVERFLAAYGAGAEAVTMTGAPVHLAPLTAHPEPARQAGSQDYAV